MTIQSTRLVADRAVEIHTERHTVLSDVPAKIGGKDIAPTPHDYVEIALAGCTVITLKMFAERKQIPLDDVHVTIKMTAEGATNAFLREIRLVGDLTDEQKTQLMDIAEKCPIHKLLSAGATITTESLA